MFNSNMEYDNYRETIGMITGFSDTETAKREQRNPFPLTFCIQLFLRHIVEGGTAQQCIVSAMCTDGKENGAVIFLGMLYNIIPGKKTSSVLLTAIHPHSHIPL